MLPPLHGRIPLGQRALRPHRNNDRGEGSLSRRASDGCGQAQKVHSDIRAYLASFDADVASKVQILYGGSCNAKTAPALFAQPDIDGGLVGGASLKAPDFSAISEAAVANA